MPGRMERCSSASSAVRLRRGSTTTSLPPRAWSARAARASRARSSASRWTRAGWRRASAGVGAVDVGDRDRERRPEHQRAGDLLGPLVDRAGREDVAGAERLDHDAAVEQRREAVGGRVAEVDADRVAAVLGGDRRQAVADQRRTPRPRSRREPPSARGPAGSRRRSGSSCSCFSAAPFGQMKPWLNTSSRSPRTLTTSSPRG